MASVRAVVAGSITSKVRFEADSLNSAKYLLHRIYGRENVISIQHGLSEDDGVIKPFNLKSSK